MAFSTFEDGDLEEDWASAKTVGALDADGGVEDWASASSRSLDEEEKRKIAESIVRSSQQTGMGGDLARQDTDYQAATDKLRKKLGETSFLDEVSSFIPFESLQTQGGKELRQLQSAQEAAAKKAGSVTLQISKNPLDWVTSLTADPFAVSMEDVRNSLESLDRIKKNDALKSIYNPEEFTNFTRDAAAENWDSNENGWHVRSNGEFKFSPQLLTDRTKFADALKGANIPKDRADAALGMFDQKQAEDRSGLIALAKKTPTFQNFAAQPENQGKSDEEVYGRFEKSGNWVDWVKSNVVSMPGQTVQYVSSQLAGAAFAASALSDSSGDETMAKVGRALNDFTKDFTPYDVRYSNVAGQTVSQFVPQIATKVGLDLALRRFGVKGQQAEVVSQAFTALSAGAQIGAENYRTVFEANQARYGTDEAHKMAMEAFKKSVPLGVSELLSLDVLLSKAPKGKGWAVVKNLASSLAEVGTEQFQNAMSNTINKGASAAYVEPQTMGLGESLEMAAGTSLVELAVGGVQRRVRNIAEQRVKEEAEKVRQAAANASSSDSPQTAAALEAIAAKSESEAPGKIEGLANDLLNEMEDEDGADETSTTDAQNQYDEKKSQNFTSIGGGVISQGTPSSQQGTTPATGQPTQSQDGQTVKSSGSYPEVAGSTPAPATPATPTLRESVLASGVPEEAVDTYIANLQAEGLSDTQIQEIADNTRVMREDASKKNEADAEARREVARRARAGDSEARAQLERERGINAEPPAPVAEPAVAATADQKVQVTNIDSIINQGGGTVAVQERGRAVKFKQFGLTIDGDTAEVAFVEIDPSEYGRGIGLEAYRSLGSELAARGITLRSSGAQYGPGRNLWLKLATQGNARQIGQGRFEFVSQATATPSTPIAEPATPPTNQVPPPQTTNEGGDLNELRMRNQEEGQGRTEALAQQEPTVEAGTEAVAPTTSQAEAPAPSVAKIQAKRSENPDEFDNSDPETQLSELPANDALDLLRKVGSTLNTPPIEGDETFGAYLERTGVSVYDFDTRPTVFNEDEKRYVPQGQDPFEGLKDLATGRVQLQDVQLPPAANEVQQTTPEEQERNRKAQETEDFYRRNQQTAETETAGETSKEAEAQQAKETARLTAEAEVSMSGDKGAVSGKRLPVREIPTGRSDESGRPITKVVPGFVNDSNTMAEVLYQNRGVERVYVPSSEIENLDPEDIFVEYDETGQAYVVAARHKKYGVIYADTGLTQDGASLAQLHEPTRLKNSQAQTEGKASKLKAKKAGVSEGEITIPEMTEAFEQRIARAGISKEEKEKPESVAKTLQQIYKKAQALASETVKTVTGETVSIGAELADRIGTAATNLYLARLRGVDRKGKFKDASGVVADIKKKVIAKLQKRPGTRAGVSLDQPVGEDGGTVGDFIGQRDQPLDSMGYPDVPLDSDMRSQEERGLENLAGATPEMKQDSNVQAAQPDRPGTPAEVAQRLGGLNYEEIAKNALAAAEAELTPAELKIWRETLPIISAGKKRQDLTYSRKKVVKKVQASAKEKMQAMISEANYEADTDLADSMLSAAASSTQSLDERQPRQERTARAKYHSGQIIDWNGGPTAKGFDTKRVLSSIAEDTKLPQLVRVVARFLSNSNVDFSNVKFELIANYQKDLNWAGLYTAGDRASAGKIQINISSLHRGGNIAQTIVHEALHHVAFHKLRPSYDRTGVEKEAYRDLVRILTHVRKQLLVPEPGKSLSRTARESFSKDDDFYGVSNLDELFTETLTNERFAAWLSSQAPIPGMQPKNSGVFRNLYDQIKQFLKNLIGGQNVRPDSLLSQAMDNIFALANDPQDDAKIKSYQDQLKINARNRVAASFGASDFEDLDIPEGPGWLSSSNTFIPADEDSSVRVVGMRIGGHERAALNWLEKNRPNIYEKLYKKGKGEVASLNYGVISDEMEKLGFLRITGDSSTLYFTGKPTTKQVSYLKDIGMILEAQVIHDLGSRSRTIYDPNQFSTAASRAQRTRMMNASGGWKAAGGLTQNLMDSQVSELIDQKDAAIRGANFKVSETARKFDRLVKKHKPNAQILNAALGSTENTLTDTQYDAWQKLQRAAKRETDPVKRQAAMAASDSYRLTQVQANNKQIRADRQAALNKLPKELADTVDVMRGHIDGLSKTLKNKGLVGNNLQITLGANLEVYLNRSYEVFDNPEWADFILTDQSPESQLIRNNAARILKAQLVAEEARRIRRDARMNNTPVPTRAQAIAAAQATVTTNDVGILMQDYLRVGDNNGLTISGGNNPAKKDTSILKLRGQIPKEIRELWGEYKDPQVNYAKTYMKMAGFVATHNFQQDFLNMGLSRATPFLWKDGSSQGVRPTSWVEIVPGLKDKPNPNPLAGVYGPPIIAEAFEDIRKTYKHSLVNDWMTGLTGLAMASKTIYNPPQTYVRNILGNGLIMVSQGYVLTDIGRLGFLTRLANSTNVAGPSLVGARPERSTAVTDYVERMIKLGVMGDNVKANVIKNLTSVVFDRDPGKAFNGALSKALTTAKGVNDRLTDAYQAGDDLWKIVAFESERSVFARAFPNATPESIDRMAADRVRDVVPTYSKIPQAVQEVVKRQPYLAPYISWTSEIIRTFANTYKHGWNDATSNNPVLRASGLKRLASVTVAQGLLGALAYGVRELSGMDAEDEERLRRFLPDWQVNALLMLTGKKEDGKFSFWDLSYLNPYDVLHEPFIAMGREIKAGGDFLGVASKGLSKFVDPWTSEQIFFGALMDAARGVTAEGRPLFEQSDSEFNKNRARISRIVDSITPGAFNFGKRMYKAATGQMTPSGRAYNLNDEFLGAISGQRPSEVDPLQSFKQRNVTAMNRMLQSADSLATKEYRKGGTPDLTKIRENYVQANDARLASLREIRKDVDALVGLGIPNEKVMQTLAASGVSKQDMEQIAAGKYVRRAPSNDALLNAVGLPEYKARIEAMRGAVESYPEVQSLYPSDQP